MVDDLISVNITGYWKKYESIIYRTREIIDEPKLYFYTEYLYNEIMKKYDKAPDISKLRYQST